MFDNYLPKINLGEEFQFIPEHVEYPAVRLDADEDIGHCHELELGVLSVREVDFWLPDSFYQVGVVKVQSLGDV